MWYNVIRETLDKADKCRLILHEGVGKIKLKVEYLDIDKLKPYENNPRINEAAVDKVAESIEEFGFRNPIIVDADNVIVAGHTRLLSAKQLGYAEVPVIRASDLTEKQIKAYRIADNKTSEFAEWDFDLLEVELEGLDDIFTGFSDRDIDNIMTDKDDAENPYTSKVDIPQYDVAGENPSVNDIYDKRKAEMLIDEINNYDLDDEVREFLTYGAYRHIVFNYRKIAEYYVNASPDIQKLIECSAMVIIDYEDAIKNGFVALNEGIMEMLDEDEEVYDAR